MAKSIEDLGEFGLIDHLTKDIKLFHKSTIKGVGDDAAVLDYGKNFLVVTTDLLIEGVHFDLVYTPLKHLGYKAVAVNLSDVYAMNAHPKQITVSLAISGKFSLDAVEEIYAGIHLACDRYQVDLVGGDTTSSFTGMMISITAVGEVDKKKIVYRSGAKGKNLICVSGDLGGAYMGVQVLKREKQIFKDAPEVQPELDNYQYVLGRQLKPEPRRDVIELLEKLKVQPTAMIDISDGLSSELFHICQKSDTGCLIYEDKIPIHENTVATAEEMNIHPATTALDGGEDYEMLFTVSLNDLDKVKDVDGFSIIGYITEKSEGMRMQTKQGELADLKALGWKSFDIDEKSE
ncbi:MAG: thiamine-phosphate kinase [Bacteroidales bacterium]|nr:thiamine-phosphate kinase [Bacteroidales bacterium]